MAPVHNHCPDYSFLNAAEIAGFSPARQDRSRRTTVALIEAAAAALRERTLDQLPLNALCRKVGMTVGAFYTRFESKEAFFRTLLFVVNHRRTEAFDALLQELDFANAPLPDLCHALVTFLADGIRANRGILLAALEHHRTGGESYATFRALGTYHKTALVRSLGPRLKGLPARQQRLRVGFAYEAVTGAMMHALQVAPGPLGLDDKAFVTELSRMMVGYLHSS